MHLRRRRSALCCIAPPVLHPDLSQYGHRDDITLSNSSTYFNCKKYLEAVTKVKTSAKMPPAKSRPGADETRSDVSTAREKQGTGIGHAKKSKTSGPANAQAVANLNSATNGAKDISATNNGANTASDTLAAQGQGAGVSQIARSTFRSRSDHSPLRYRCHGRQRLFHSFTHIAPHTISQRRLRSAHHCDKPSLQIKASDVKAQPWHGKEKSEGSPRISLHWRCASISTAPQSTRLTWW